MNIWKSNTKRSKKGQTSGSRHVCSSLGGEDASEDINDANASGLPDVLLTHSLIGSTNHSSNLLQSSGYFGEVEERRPLYPNTTDYYTNRRTLDSSVDLSRVPKSESYAIDEGGPSEPIRQQETSRRGRTEYDSQSVSVGHRVPVDGSTNYTNWQSTSQYVNSATEAASVNPYPFAYNQENIPHSSSYDYNTIGSPRDRSQGSSNYKQLQENSKSLRYRSASSEPKSRDRRRDRRSRCSSATRAKNLNGQPPPQSQTNSYRTQYIDNSLQSFNLSHQGSENYPTNYAEQHNPQLAQQKDIFQSIQTPHSSTMQYNQAIPNDPLSLSEDYRSQPNFSNNQPDPSLPMSHSNQSSWQAQTMGMQHQPMYDDENRTTRQQQQPLYHDTGSPMLSQDSFKNSGVYDAAQQMQRLSVVDPLATESLEPTAPQFPSKPPDGGGEYGYRVPDLDGLLTQSSSSQPANLPMVLSAATRLHHMRRTVASSSRPFLPLGVIVNAIFKTRDWLYVRTAHGAEGFVPYHVCLPLGILPANNRLQNQQIDNTPSAAWEISQTDAGVGGMTQERGRCRERRRPAPQAEVTITTNQTDLQKLQPHSSDML